MPATHIISTPRSDNTWHTWATGITTTSTAVSYEVWDTWIYQTSNTTNTTSTAWYQWNTTGTSTVPTRALVVERTEEEIAAELERQRIRRDRHQAEMVALECKKKEANERAYKLLTENLTPQQLADFNEFGCFNVVSLKGNNYRIRKGSVGNLDALDANGRTTGRLCVHPQGGVPYGDIMLAQKLLLEAGEEDMLIAKANRHGFEQPKERVPAIRKVA